ncbi:kininogen-1 [Gouania willdenowi]|uniref:kininogen-1 n=1 Tax=Gouania willdenowi TaxID=441366 RepID=UPI0010543360|nr:kininogen-like [Gouania willdenowi]
MRSGVGLCVLGLLCLHSSSFGQETVEIHPGVLIFCDDPSVERAVHSAVHKFNQMMVTGNKLALYQILTATKVQNGSDSTYSLEFTSRSSDCPTGSSKPWTDCDYLPSRHKKAILCNATVLMTETNAETQQVHCNIEDHITTERASCMGCPEPIDENSEDLKVPVSVSIAKFNSMSDSTHLFTLHEVGYATRQVVAGFRFNFQFDMKKTVCSKAEHKDLNELCVADEENLEFANCFSTVDTAPWRLETPAVQIQCEAGPLPPRASAKRRPPGFTPLRAMPHSSPSPPTSAPPTQPAVKEESSEEDISGSKVPPSPHPFHCPSKPWKPFHPLLSVPTKSPTEAPTAQPPAEGTFSDTDLLS